MFVTYYIKLFRTGVDRRNGILMSLLLPVAGTINLRKGFSTQQSLIAIIEKWSNNMDKGKSCAALLTDMSKAFDCIVHEFLPSYKSKPILTDV